MRRLGMLNASKMKNTSILKMSELEGRYQEIVDTIKKSRRQKRK